MPVKCVTTLRYFFLAVMASILHLKKNGPLYNCGINLKGITFRLPGKSRRDPIICLRIYKRILFDVFKNQTPFKKYDSNSGQAILDGNLDSTDLRYNYIEKFSGARNDLIIAKDNLLHFSGLSMSLFTIFILFVTFVPVFLISLFSKDKIHYPFLVKEYLECLLLQQILSRNKITHLNYFCIYERDANLCAYILMKSGIYVNKIPSEVPLHFWNKIVVANQLSFCFAYQVEEFEAFKATMFVEKTEHWAPEKILESPARFQTPRQIKINPLYDIGFFSSANWLRYLKGDVDMEHNDRENEKLILDTLVNLTAERNLSLRIFAHPLEKIEENHEATKNYYHNILKNPGISLADFDKPSIEGFDEINTAISLYSTLMFERIHLGFKTILAPFDYHDFPLKSSPFKNICVSNTSELKVKIEESLPLSDKVFFEKYKLINYTNSIN